MSDISVSWQELASLPARLSSIDTEVRALYPLLSAGPAMATSAPIVATAIEELTGSLVASLERSLASLTHDIDGLRKAMRTYQSTEDATVEATQRVCRQMPPMNMAR